MSECVLSEARKVVEDSESDDEERLDNCQRRCLRHRMSKLSCHLDGYQNAERAPGVRRDRTSHFLRMRHAEHPGQLPSQPRRLAPSHDAGTDAPAWEEVQSLYEQYAITTVSLAQTLSQLVGIVRFGTDFSTRVAPLEMRICASATLDRIGELFCALEKLLQDVQDLEIPSWSRNSTLREKLAVSIGVFLDQKRLEFAEQMITVENLRESSPLTSPVPPDRIGKRLSEAMQSSSPFGSPSQASRCPSFGNSPEVSPSLASRSPGSSCDRTPMPPMRFPSIADSSECTVQDCDSGTRTVALFSDDGIATFATASKHPFGSFRDMQMVIEKASSSCIAVEAQVFDASDCIMRYLVFEDIFLDHSLDSMHQISGW